jgi:hypothetical protein
MFITQQVQYDLKALITANLDHWQSYIEPATDDDDEVSYLDLTIGLSDAGDEWSYQTGDNSFSGGAYCFPNWAVISFATDSNVDDVVADLLREIEWIEVYNQEESL